MSSFESVTSSDGDKGRDRDGDEGDEGLGRAASFSPLSDLLCSISYRTGSMVSCPPRKSWFMPRQNNVVLDLTDSRACSGAAILLIVPSLVILPLVEDAAGGEYLSH
jgi:hypothetical protein